MTEIKYRHKSKSFELTVTGHAEYSKNKEPDIVCSAISALVSTLGSKISELEEKNVFQMCPKIILESGNAVIKARVRETAKSKVQNYFELTAHGLELIALEYPENVSFEKS